MRRILAVCIAFALLTLTSHAAELSHYLTGVWYGTKAPNAHERTGGELDLYLYSDGSIEVKAWFNGEARWVGSGSWQYSNVIESKIAVAFTINTPVVHTYTGILRENFPFTTDYFGKGIFRGATGYNGKWQVTGY